MNGILDMDNLAVEEKVEEIEVVPSVVAGNTQGIKLPADIALAVDLLNVIKTVPQTVKALAVTLSTDEAFLHRIVKHLSKAGIVKAVRGPGGGVSAVSTDVTLGDVYMAFNKTTVVDNTRISGQKSVFLMELLSKVKVVL